MYNKEQYQNLIVALENRDDYIQLIDSNLPIFIEHAVKFATLEEFQNSHWTGSMINAGKAIVRVQKESPSVFKPYNKINYDNYNKKIVNLVLSNNEGKTEEDFKFAEVYAYFSKLEDITDVKNVKKFLTEYNKVGNKMSEAIKNFHY